VATADRRIKDIAKEIELTSVVIEELGDVFKLDETSTLMSKKAFKTANQTMQECSTVFAEIDETLKKSKRNTFGRLMLPFRDSKIELLRSHIDKLKSSLSLLMHVLSYAHQVAAKKLDREAEAEAKAQIQELIEHNKKSDRKYQESLRNFSISDDGSGDPTLVDPDEAVPAVQTVSLNPNHDLTVAIKAIGSTINPKTLETCVQHVRTLLSSIETLQQALTDAVDGSDHSAHHQTLVNSYFAARGHLDGVIFNGNPQRSPSVDGIVEMSQTHQSTLPTDAHMMPEIGHGLHNDGSDGSTTLSIIPGPPSPQEKRERIVTGSTLAAGAGAASILSHLSIDTNRNPMISDISKTTPRDSIDKNTTLPSHVATAASSTVRTGHQEESLKSHSPSNCNRHTSSKSTKTGSNRKPSSNIATSTNNEIRLRVDRGTPLNLQLSGDMEGRSLQLVPAESGMSDVVIGGGEVDTREDIYQSEGSGVVILKGRDRRSTIARQGSRDAGDFSERSEWLSV
jgi:hypothetical protein